MVVKEGRKDGDLFGGAEEDEVMVGVREENEEEVGKEARG